MPVSEETYQRVALEDDDTKWELHCGRLVEKPIMTAEHNDTIDELYGRLRAQLTRDEWAIRSDSGKLRPLPGSIYVPDLFVIPRASVRRLREQPGTFEVYNEPVPLVVEVWSPSTGRYDVDTKIPEYCRRGDLEIWRLHPYERTLTAWRRQPDGTYIVEVFRGGLIRPVALPGVVIDLDTLFD